MAAAPKNPRLVVWAVPAVSDIVSLLISRSRKMPGMRAGRIPGWWLERVLQCHLHLAHGVGGAGDLSESSSRRRSPAVPGDVRACPGRMVGGIERLHAELQLVAFTDLEVFQDGSVEERVRRTHQAVARHVAELPGKGRSPIGDVEPLIRAALPTGQVGILAVGVRADFAIAALVHGVDAGAGVQREPGLGGPDGADLPSPKQHVGDAALVDEELAFAEGKLVENRCDEAGGNIKCRKALVAGHAGAILREDIDVRAADG